MGLDDDLLLVSPDMFIPVDVPAESAEDNLVEDLVRDEDEESTSKDHPAKGEENGSHQVE